MELIKAVGLDIVGNDPEKILEEKMIWRERGKSNHLRIIGLYVIYYE